MPTRKILSGTYWLLAGRLVSNAIGLASTLIAARFLLPDDFGLVAIAMGVFGIAGALVELPVGIALVQLETATKADYNTAWTINVIRGGLVAALMAVSGWPVSIIYDDPRLITVILALALYPALLGLRNSWFEAYTRDMDFRWEALVEASTKLVSFAVVILVCLMTRSYWALPLGLIASGVTALLLSFILSPYLPRFCLSEFRKFFGFSVWLGLGHIADSLRDTAATFLIGKFSGHAKLGAWSVGNLFADRLELVLYAPMERTLFAAFSSIRQDRPQLQATYLTAWHTGAAFIFPVCAGMGLVSQEIVAIALGPKWEIAGRVLAFLAPAMALNLLSGLATSLLTSLGVTRAVFEAKAVMAVLQITLILIGVQLAGLTGALCAVAASNLLWMALSTILVARHAGISLQSQARAIARSGLAALIMSIAVLAARQGLFWMADESLTHILLRGTCLSCLGALTYVSGHLILWHLSGRPPGIEHRFMTLFAKRSSSHQGHEL